MSDEAAPAAFVGATDVEPEPLLGPVDLEGLEEAVLLVQDLLELAPVEALPIEMLPAFVVGAGVAAAVTPATGWLPRALVFFGRHAYLMAFLGALIENTILLGFLLPGGAVVALAAAGARAGGLSLPVVIVLASAGMTAGATLDYLIGRSGVARLLAHPRAGRVGRFLSARLDQAAPLLKRHGWWVLLIAHAFGHGRSSMAVAAGATGLPLRRFLAMEAPAALVWGTVFGAGGYALGGEWQMLELALRRAGWAGATLLILGGLVWLVVSRRRVVAKGVRLAGAFQATGTGQR